MIWCLQEGLWATNINTGSLNGMMEYYQCPPGYCQCSREDDEGNICNSVYYYDDDDQQCVCDRQGGVLLLLDSVSVYLM